MYPQHVLRATTREEEGAGRKELTLREKKKVKINANKQKFRIREALRRQGAF